MDDRLLLNEAIDIAKQNGNPVLKKKLAEKLWPGRKTVTQQVNMTNLCNGSTKSFTKSMLSIICKELKCTSDFLLDIKH